MESYAFNVFGVWVFLNITGWGFYLAEGGGIPDGTRLFGAELIALAMAIFFVTAMRADER